MEQPLASQAWKPKLLLGAISFLVATAGASAWFYYNSRLQDVPPLQPTPPQPARPVARIVLAPQPPNSPSANTPAEPPSPPSNVPERPQFHLSVRRQLDDFREGLKKTVMAELSPAFPELPAALKDPETNVNDPSYERVIFQLLDAEKQAPAERQPALLYAADVVASHLGCERYDSRGKEREDCARLRSDLARYNLTLAYDELGAGTYYPRDLLWRIWNDYPETDWGERVFLLLLDNGWDTSFTCAKGSDQTKEVIHQGESFLQKRPNSPYRGIVTLLVAEAYASRWSLSNEPAGSGMSDYVDPKQFQEGSEEARTKAIALFEEVLRLAPGTSFSEFAQEVLPPLRDRQILDNYRFYCVYD